MRSKGYFAVFRILIGAIIGLAMLVIIVSVINYFRNINVSASYERYVKGFQNALEGLGENEEQGLIVEKDLLLVKGYYTSSELAEKFKIDPECIELQTHNKSIFKEIKENKSYFLIRDSTMNVFFQCIKTEETTCGFKCIVSFGRKPEWE